MLHIIIFDVLFLTFLTLGKINLTHVCICFKFIAYYYLCEMLNTGHLLVLNTRPWPDWFLAMEQQQNQPTKRKIMTLGLGHLCLRCIHVSWIHDKIKNLKYGILPCQNKMIVMKISLFQCLKTTYTFKWFANGVRLNTLIRKHLSL